MKVTLVTPWGIPCGIAEHSAYLKEALENAPALSEEAGSITVAVETDLHPGAILGTALVRDRGSWLILNYHAALHSQWTPEHVRLAQTSGLKVLIIYHDSGVPNSEQCQRLYAVADRFIVQEPCEDLPGAVYLRQGIPKAASVGSWWYDNTQFKDYPSQPVVGTIGFPFPWKNYDLLAEASERAGWALVLIAPGATYEQRVRWQTLNPQSLIITDFLHRDEALALLAACDATAFLYSTMNAGTSGAIRQGIAARKPVLASGANICRQFRDLAFDPVGARAITWLQDLSVEGVAQALAFTQAWGLNYHTVRLAHQDRWAVYGERVAQILRGES